MHLRVVTAYASVIIHISEQSQWSFSFLSNLISFLLTRLLQNLIKFLWHLLSLHVWFLDQIHPNLDNYLFLKTKILQVAIGKLDHYTTSGPSLYLLDPDPLMHHQLDYFNIVPLISIWVVANQQPSVCRKHFELFAFIVDVRKDNLPICPEVFPDTSHII